MSQPLIPLSFPLHGARLIEASAGTGKTWTIAALYLRLVLGHGQEQGFYRALLPSEILVMTFTRAATKELSNRIRERLVEAAGCFRGTVPVKDTYLRELISAYPEGEARQKAAFRLMVAAESMDDAAVLTIDSWCQRMLREHAFDSGSLFDEELVSDEKTLFEHAVRDYWRAQVYRLDSEALAVFMQHWPDVFALEKDVKKLVANAELLGTAGSEPLLKLISRIHGEQLTQMRELKAGWPERIARLESWVDQHREADPKCFNGNKFKVATVSGWFAALREWAGSSAVDVPALNDTAWNRLSKANVEDARAKHFTAAVPDEFDAVAELRTALAGMAPIKHDILRHAVIAIAARMDALKLRSRQFGFSDMLLRLKVALLGENGPALRERIARQYPVALIDEFQDTSPDQYAIFNALYRIADNHPANGIFLIGDPKQSIYGFRGADIYSYLKARKATEGRHYLLDTNFRSTPGLVGAVNAIFEYAEHGADGTGFPAGAFRFRNGNDNPLPFEPVRANGRAETLVGATGHIKAMTFWCCENQIKNKTIYHELFAAQCAETIVQLLNDEQVGFVSNDGFVRLQPADIAILVRDRLEASAIRNALQRRKVASVYLSDKDSVIASDEAADILRWLQAVSNPTDSSIARAAYATRMAALPLTRLVELASDDRAWEGCVEQLKALHLVWQRQGVLAMLRRLIHELDLPARLLNQTGGERSLTNLLHLAEIVQGASENLDGEQSLIRWLAEQIQDEDSNTDERILRLESDAELVKVCTVHKSKGLEYPLVFIPFGVSAKPVTKARSSFLEYVDEEGNKNIDLTKSDAALKKAEAARLEEDVRLLYVALTRARHAVWLGVASMKEKGNESALGYLIRGEAALPGVVLRETLNTVRGSCPDMEVEVIDQQDHVTLLSRTETRPELIDAPTYTQVFENDWSIGSFSSLTRAMVSSAVPVRLLDNGDDPQNGATLTDIVDAVQPAQSVWHQFPRGSRPGQFLHEQLEWMGNEGFNIVDETSFAQRFNARCERAGWDNRQEEALAWLSNVAATPLLPFNRTLKQIDTSMPEMEFWFSSERMATGELDQFCKERLLDGTPRADLPGRDLHGLLMGFADLVFEQDGKYWVLDYKSNYLGTDDSAYHQPALAHAMAAHRYDVQAAIYLLALHRLLKSRLGSAYSVESHLGGAIFLFLRGIDNQETHGCYHVSPDTALMNGLDRLFSESAT